MLDIPSLTIPDKGVFGVFGPSGSGKTTLLRLIAGLDKPDCGAITGAEDKKISFLFQEDRLLPNLTALQNVALVSDDSAALKALESVELLQHRDKYPAQLSGGMCRRVAFARAAAFGGDMLLLDEPFKGLDEELVDTVSRLILEKSATTTVIIVAHDAPAMRLAEKSYRLSGNI